MLWITEKYARGHENRQGQYKPSHFTTTLILCTSCKVLILTFKINDLNSTLSHMEYDRWKSAQQYIKLPIRDAVNLHLSTEVFLSKPLRLISLCYSLYHFVPD